MVDENQEETQEEKRENERLVSLPVDALADLHEQIRINRDSPSTVKAYMDQTWVPKGPAYSGASASLSSYRRYMKQNLPEIDRLFGIKQQSLTVITPEVETAVAALTSPDVSIDDKRKALTNLVKNYKDRQEFIKAAQASLAHVDPSYEAILAGYMKGEHEVYKSMITLQDALNRDQEKESIDDLVEGTRVMITNIKNRFKLEYNLSNGVPITPSQFNAMADKVVEGVMGNFIDAKKKLLEEKA